MADHTGVISIAWQMMGGDKIAIEGGRFPVQGTSVQSLRTVLIRMERRQYAPTEQKPEKRSRWSQIIRQGHQVVQFKDVQSNRFVAVAVAVAVDGEAKV